MTRNETLDEVLAVIASERSHCRRAERFSDDASCAASRALDRVIACIAAMKRVEEPAGFHGPNRCEVTGNLCGTDTWMVGRSCGCGPCQEYVRRLDAMKRAEEPDNIQVPPATIRGWLDQRDTARSECEAWHARADAHLDAANRMAAERNAARAQVRELCEAAELAGRELERADEMCLTIPWVPLIDAVRELGDLVARIRKG